MGLKTRAFLFQLACFALLFIGIRYLIDEFTMIQGIWIPLTAFVAGTILSPQFRVLKTPTGEKLFMKWLFMKGIKQVG